MSTTAIANTVLSLPEAAKSLTVSLATLRRAISRGEGPTVIRLSQRRVGIRSADLLAWLDEQTIQGLKP